MKTKYVLLVEDNADDVALTRDAFREARIANEIVVASDGAAALDFLFKSAADLPPSLVLLDLKLPKVDGLEVLRRIRTHASTKRLPVVMLTSSREEQDLIASYDLGANSYIRKPVDFDQFVAATKQLGLYWLLLNEAPPPVAP
jgi:two-component system response regulator